jgi:hypothetical protein
MRIGIVLVSVAIECNDQPFPVDVCERWPQPVEPDIKTIATTIRERNDKFFPGLLLYILLLLEIKISLKLVIGKY